MAWEKREIHSKFYSKKKMREREHLEDLGVNAIILGINLKGIGRECVDCIHLHLHRGNGGCCEHGSNFRFLQKVRNFSVTEMVIQLVKKSIVVSSFVGYAESTEEVQRNAPLHDKRK